MTEEKRRGLEEIKSGKRRSISDKGKGGSLPRARGEWASEKRTDPLYIPRERVPGR